MLKSLLALLTLALLTACGGGGGGGSSPIPSGPTTPVTPPTNQPPTTQAKLRIGTQSVSRTQVRRIGNLIVERVGMDASPSPSPTPTPSVAVASIPSMMWIPDSYIQPSQLIGQVTNWAYIAYLDNAPVPAPSPMPDVTWSFSGVGISDQIVPVSTFNTGNTVVFPEAVSANPLSATGITNVTATVAAMSQSATMQVNTYNLLAIAYPVAQGIPSGLAFDVNGVAQPVTDMSQADVYIDGTNLHFPYGADLYQATMFQTVLSATGQKVFTTISTADAEWNGTGGIAHQNQPYVIFQTKDGRWVKLQLAGLAFTGANPNTLVEIQGVYRVSGYNGLFDI